MYLLSFSDLDTFGPLLSKRALERQRLLAEQLLRSLEGQIRLHKEQREKWRGYEGVLALYGLRIAFLLRKKQSPCSLSFFALRVPKTEFEVPEWMI